jgi:hypothetical protein
MVVWGMCLWSTRAGVQGVLPWRSVDRCGVVESKKPWASPGCSVLTLCMSGYVVLDRPPPRWTFWSLVGGERGSLQGMTHGLGSHQAPGGRGELIFLCHAPCVTLSWERPARLHPKCSVWEPPSLGGSGLVFLRSGLG